MARRGLGRGLEALIPEARVKAGERLQKVAVTAIRPNPYQPRREFDQDALRELANSIATHGVIQPLVVREREDGFDLIAGERRWRAAQMAGLDVVPVVTRVVEEERLLEIALVENLQREDLNAMEEAEAIERLAGEREMNHEELAAVLGRSRSAVANSLRLLGLPQSVQALVRAGRLSAGHARAVLSLPPSQQEEAARLAVAKQLSVREIEALARKARARRPQQERPSELLLWEERLGAALEVPVHISGGRRTGTIEIRFRGRGELERLLHALVPDDEE